MVNFGVGFIIIILSKPIMTLLRPISCLWGFDKLNTMTGKRKTSHYVPDLG